MRCSKCQLNKSPEEFHIDRSRSRGRTMHCKLCMSEYGAIYAEREKPAPISDIRHCTKCEEDKPLTEFYKDKSRRDGYTTICKICRCTATATYRAAQPPELIQNQKNAWKKTPAGRACTQRYLDKNKDDLNARKRSRYAANPEAIHTKIHHWRIKNPERAQAIIDRGNAKRLARLKAAPINDFDKTQWLSILELFQFRCAYCHGSFNRLERDHILPLSANGPNTKSNIAPACRSCNSKKGDKILGVDQAELLYRLATGNPLFPPRRRRAS